MAGALALALTSVASGFPVRAIPNDPGGRASGIRTVLASSSINRKSTREAIQSSKRPHRDLVDAERWQPQVGVLTLKMDTCPAMGIAQRPPHDK